MIRQPSYFLAPHTFLARVENVVILLDSETDDYILIDASATPRFLALLSESVGMERFEQTIEQELVLLLDELERHGSITSDARRGKPLEILSMISCSREIPGPHIDAIPKVGFGHVIAMAIAMATTFYLLRIRGLKSALQFVEKLKAKENIVNSRYDIRDIVEIYHRVRPFFYSSKDMCLFNSLSMIIFLSKYGSFPAWCFGVSVKPFQAHCWVEDDQWLYNDQYARIWRFTPIMRV